MKRLTKPLYFLAIFLILLSVLAIAWAYPKSEPHPMSKMYTAYYRGFDVAELPILSKHYYKVAVKDNPDSWWEADCCQEGFNKYRGYYNNGNIMAEGEIYVELSEHNSTPPTPDVHMVRDGKYYNPDGELVSSITNGTGVQTFYFGDGQLSWRLELKNYKRVEGKMWAYNGKLVSHFMYLEDGTEKYLHNKK